MLRAQLIEDGHEVVAIDAWPMPRVYRRPEMKPHLLIVDLQGLPAPRQTLREMALLMPRDRVLVLTALGTMTGHDVRRLGFTVIERPTTIGHIAATASSLRRPALRSTTPDAA